MVEITQLGELTHADREKTYVFKFRKDVDQEPVQINGVLLSTPFAYLIVDEHGNCLFSAPVEEVSIVFDAKSVTSA